MRYVCAMQTQAVTAYRPMTLTELAVYLADEENGSVRWRYVLEFLKEYRWESPEVRSRLLADEPPTTRDERWDVLLAAIAEHLATRDHSRAPAWSESRILQRSWFPFNTPAARVDAFVHAPIAFRRRGVFVPGRGLEVL